MDGFVRLPRVDCAGLVPFGWLQLVWQSGPQALQVSTAVLKPEQFRELGDYVATLEAVNQVQLAALADGRVVELPVEEGQQVEQGEVLLRLSSDERQRGIDSCAG